MSAEIKLLGETTADEVWKGHAEVNREGVELAVEMLCELEKHFDLNVNDGIATAEFCQVEDWPRRGRPFRNVVLEYLQRARQTGSDVEAGFCAILSDYVSSGALETTCCANDYVLLFGLDEEKEAQP